MLATARPVVFLAISDPVASRDLYARVLGLTLREEMDLALVFACNGAVPRVQKVEQVVVAPYTAGDGRSPTSI